MVEWFESAPAHEACASVNARHPHFFQRRMGREESLNFLPRTTLRSARIKRTGQPVPPESSHHSSQGRLSAQVGRKPGH
ncbi:hypothetical protein SEA_RADFAD_97 [Arthrobacter phage RadFad]|nr:hypothetical protein SEA_RADFAD_97 [Arthrobacter phage RadFad]